MTMLDRTEEMCNFIRWHICSSGWQFHNGTYLTLSLTLTIALPLTLLTLMVTVT